MSAARARARPTMAETYVEMVREANRQGVVVLVGEDDGEPEVLLYGNVDGMDQRLRGLLTTYPTIAAEAARAVTFETGEHDGGRSA